MSHFKQYKFASRKIRTRCDQDKVTVSRGDFEDLVYTANISCEQAEQLQTIIENLQKIKAEAVRKILDKIVAEIEDRETYDGIYLDRYDVLAIIDKYRGEQT